MLCTNYKCKNSFGLMSGEEHDLDKKNRPEEPAGKKTVLISVGPGKGFDIIAQNRVILIQKSSPEC
jgi:hypothetical protein